MNKLLFVKVKDLCKDTGLSEKYLKAITEKLGGSIEDDSTDSEAIETTANLVADVAKESQGEATRWANKKQTTKKKSTSEEDDEEDEEDETTGKKKNKKKPEEDDPILKRLQDLENELAAAKAEKSKGDRAADVKKAMEKHKIPSFLQDRISVPEDKDADEYVAQLKQDLITNGLMSEQAEGVKSASEKQVDEAAEDLLKSITV